MIGMIAAVAVLLGLGYLGFAVISEVVYQIAMRRADQAEVRALEAPVTVRRTQNA